MIMSFIEINSMRSAEEAPEPGADPGGGNASGQWRETGQTSRRVQPERTVRGRRLDPTSSMPSEEPLEEESSRPSRTTRRRWTREDNIDIMKAYFLANSCEDVPARGIMGAIPMN
uniref:Uncharacterized protein n=1 Tax=Cacopsylla melanoneura TaxID=428564 RepID=A0A8D9BAM3_9HEMI